MDETRFWQIIGEAYRPDLVEQTAALEAALRSCKWFEVIDFQAHFERFVAAADTPGLRAAAFLVNGSDSERGFRDFRLGLVASGRRAYEAALQEADALGDYLEGDPLDGFGLDQTAVRAYETLTGGSDFFVKLAERQLPPQQPTPPLRLPPEAEMRRRLPNLSALYPPPEDGADS